MPLGGVVPPRRLLCHETRPEREDLPAAFEGLCEQQTSFGIRGVAARVTACMQQAEQAPVFGKPITVASEPIGKYGQPPAYDPGGSHHPARSGHAGPACGAAVMLKHRGFPGRLPGTDFQFTIRRANAKGATRLVARERYRDRRPADSNADLVFVRALWEHFGDQPFERGNLDAGRLSWLFGREVLPAEDPFDPESYESLLVLDVPAARAAFPDAFNEDLWE